MIIAVVIVLSGIVMSSISAFVTTMFNDSSSTAMDPLQKNRKRREF